MYVLLPLMLPHCYVYCMCVLPPLMLLHLPMTLTLTQLPS